MWNSSNNGIGGETEQMGERERTWERKKNERKKERNKERKGKRRDRIWI